MRWLWIDRVLHAEPGTALTAVKTVSLSEPHLHDHFPAATRPDGQALPAHPVMPAPLILEGMAQTAGILVGLTQNFAEKVALAKVSSAIFHADALPGDTLRFHASLDSIDARGASASGTVDRQRPRPKTETNDGPTHHTTPLADISLLFSHLDQNQQGLDFPEHNFVFGETFKTLLRTSGIINEPPHT
ncbi:MAG: 3-hydroxyacyl-ACP dehydratase FabZ family protein [Planctomycetota bacterium]